MEEEMYTSASGASRSYTVFMGTLGCSVTSVRLTLVSRGSEKIERTTRFTIGRANGVWCGGMGGRD